MVAKQVEHYQPEFGAQAWRRFEVFFAAQNYPFEEGEVFYYYYKSMG